MNRRGFLKAAVVGLAGIAAAQLDPERLLWVPGARTFFIPKPLAFHPDAFAWVTKDLHDDYYLKPSQARLAEAAQDLANYIDNQARERIYGQMVAQEGQILKDMMPRLYDQGLQTVYRDVDSGISIRLVKADELSFTKRPTRYRVVQG